MKLHVTGLDDAHVRNMADGSQGSNNINRDKVLRALTCVAEGIHDFCEEPIKKYHTELLRKFPRQQCTGPCSYVILWQLVVT